LEKKNFSLDQANGIVEGQANLKAYITRFYKDFFGEPEVISFTLEEDRIFDIPQVTHTENGILTTPFTEQEVQEAIFDMEHNKAPGPDGFLAEFYQKFWNTIKGDLMQMFHDLYAGDLPLFSLNFGVITLIPKVQEANVIQQYQPICLLNTCFKIFTKVAANRLNLVADHISPTQIAFMQGRNILEGVVILHGIIHELHRKKQSRVVLKIDFEKTYDKVK
jgi:hypothetical protein